MGRGHGFKSITSSPLEMQQRRRKAVQGGAKGLNANGVRRAKSSRKRVSCCRGVGKRLLLRTTLLIDLHSRIDNHRGNASISIHRIEATVPLKSQHLQRGTSRTLTEAVTAATR